MFWAILREWSLSVLSYASGGPTVVLALFYILSGKEPPKMALLGLLGVTSIVAAWLAQIRERRLRLQEQKRQEPCLRVMKGGFYESTGVWNAGQPPTPATTFSSLTLKITNDPEVGKERSQAKEVAAILTFLTDRDDVIFEFEGRWSDSTQPPQLPPFVPPAELKTVNIPIGTTRLVGLVVKYQDEQVCYGVTNDSYNFPLFKNPDWRLEPGDYAIRVRFRATTVDQTFLLKFRNPKGTVPLEVVSYEEIATKV
jgi:hypothetical protein